MTGTGFGVATVGAGFGARVAAPAAFALTVLGDAGGSASGGSEDAGANACGGADVEAAATVAGETTGPGALAAAALMCRGGESSLTARATPTLPITRPAAIAPTSVPRVDFAIGADVTSGAEVIAAVGSGVAAYEATGALCWPAVAPGTGVCASVTAPPSL